METSTKWALGIGGALVAGATAIALLRRRRSSSFGSFGASRDLAPDEVLLKGKVTCPVSESYEFPPGKSHVRTAREYTLPARIQVKCRGEGDARRCTASYPACPRLWKDDPNPEKLDQRSVKGLRSPTGVSRGKDSAGRWNTEIRWEGKAGYTGYQNERANEEFALHFWDDRDKPNDELRNTIFYDASEFRRPYPRADLRLERDSWTIDMGAGDMSAGSRRVLELPVRAAVARGVTRHGSISSSELDSSPPIRVGGVEIDWPRRLFGPGGA